MSKRQNRSILVQAVPTRKGWPWEDIGPYAGRLVNTNGSRDKTVWTCPHEHTGVREALQCGERKAMSLQTSGAG
jgi:hypothetical protein